VKFCFVHAGAYVPTLLGRIRRGLEVYPEYARNMNADPEEYLRRLYFDTIILDSTALRNTISIIGADKFFLGSDHPFGVGDLDPVGSVEAVGLKTDQEAAIMEDNAKRLLRE
jgi:aminocarboxymuconate-semialdehyde decarboxylase